jgi:hypothetical protein
MVFPLPSFLSFLLIDFFKASNGEYNTAVYFTACSTGNLEMLHWLGLQPKRDGQKMNPDLGFIRACKFGQTAVVKHLLSQGEPSHILRASLSERPRLPSTRLRLFFQPVS